MRGRDVLAVQAHSRLEAEGVAGREACETDLLGVGEEEFCDLSWECGGDVCRDGDLEAILTCVSRAGDQETAWSRLPVGKGETQGAALAEVERAEVHVERSLTGFVHVDVGLQDRRGLWALQGQQDPVVEDLPGDAVRTVLGFVFVNFLGQEGEVILSPAGVGDEVEGVGTQTGDDGVVDDATSAILEEAR